MTLIELLVAVALSAMLMTALIGVLRGVGTQAKLASEMEQPVWPGRAVELLRRDLLAADALWQDSGTVWLTTDSPVYAASTNGASSSIDGDSGIVSRQIGYRCGGLSQSHRTLERIESSRPIILAFDVSRIRVERLDSAGSPQPLPPIPGPVPSHVRVWIWDSIHDRPVVLKDIVVR